MKVGLDIQAWSSKHVRVWDGVEVCQLQFPEKPESLLLVQSYRTDVKGFKGSHTMLFGIHPSAPAVVQYWLA